METIIVRDTDILREYAALLERGLASLSPFARIAATVKLASLRRELDSASLETTEEDLAALKHELDSRLEKTLLTRLLSRRWFARIAAILTLGAGQQLVLLLILLSTMLFVAFAPRPAWWNPILPREEPAFLYVFVFVHFFVVPALALALLFGGTMLKRWRKSLPLLVTVALFAAGATYFSLRAATNPIPRTSLSQLTAERGISLSEYRDWVNEHWLLKDAAFQRDYERYFLNGPGRRITSRIDSNDDSKWEGALALMNEYLNQGYDPQGFREWLGYYADRNRIFAEDQIRGEIDQLAGPANRPVLGVWQLEPLLKERDRRLYSTYFGAIDRQMRLWAILLFGILMLAFIGAYLFGPLLLFLEGFGARSADRASLAPETPEQSEGPTTRLERLKRWYYSYPEERGLAVTAAFDSHASLPALAHRSFIRFAVSAIVIVFAFWIVWHGLALGTDSGNPVSQVDLMKSHVLVVAATETREEIVLQSGPDAVRSETTGLSLAERGRGGQRPSLELRLSGIEGQFEDTDYIGRKRYNEHREILVRHDGQIDYISGLTSELRDTTLQLPDRVAELGSRAGAAESRLGQVMGELSSATQQVAALQRQVAEKLTEVETRVSRAADQAGRVEDQASILATRTEALERELDRRARQIEARTEELGERTAALNEREERVDRTLRLAIAALYSAFKAEIDHLERRAASSDRERVAADADSLRSRISAVIAELRELRTDRARRAIEQLEDLGRRLDQIAPRG